MRRGALPAGLRRLRRDRPALSSTGETRPIKSNYLFVVSMDVDPDKEALFNEVYDTEHVPNLLKVPGVHAAARMAGEPFVLNIGGEEKRIAQDGPPTPATGGTRSTSCVSCASVVRRSIDSAGGGTRRRAIGAGDVQAEEHDLGAAAGERCETGAVLGDQDALAEQRVVHRKRDVGRSPARRKIGRGGIDADDLGAPLLDKPGRGFAGELMILQLTRDS